MNDLLFLALALLAVIIIALRIRPYSYHVCWPIYNTHLIFLPHRALAPPAYCPNCHGLGSLDSGSIHPLPPAPCLEYDQCGVPERFKLKVNAFCCRNCGAWVMSDNLSDHIMMHFDHSPRTI